MEQWLKIILYGGLFAIGIWLESRNKQKRRAAQELARKEMSRYQEEEDNAYREPEVVPHTNYIDSILNNLDTYESEPEYEFGSDSGITPSILQEEEEKREVIEEDYIEMETGMDKKQAFILDPKMMIISSEILKPKFEDF